MNLYKSKIIFFLLLSSYCLSVTCQNSKKNNFKYKGFAGGMQLHSGYVWSNNFTLKNSSNSINRKGAVFGIGGRLHVSFGDYFRVGSEGYSSKLYYKNKSYCSLGWGGVLFDVIFRQKTISPFTGFTMGGGSQETLILSDNFTNTFQKEEFFFHKFGFMVISPFVGLEVKINQKISFVAKVDYILNISNWQPDFTTGPRIYIGVWFITNSYQKN